MEEQITITLPQKLRSELDDATRQEGVSQSKLISQAVREYLFFRRFRLLRERMMAKAQAQGVYSDQDVFDRVS